MEKIKGILFDLGWTLESPASRSWVFTRRFYEYVPRGRFEAMDPNVIRAAEAKAHRPLSEHHYTETLEEENQKFIGFYSSLNKTLSLGLSEEAIEDIAYDHTYNFANYVLFPDTLSTLKTLKEHGYRIGVLSDTWPSTVPQQKEAGAYKYYDCLTLSFELGVLKPDPRMYEDALAKMKLKPEEILYVDDLEKSLDKAASYGIVCVRSASEHPDLLEGRYPAVTSPGGVIELLKDRNGGVL